MASTARLLAFAAAALAAVAQAYPVAVEHAFGAAAPFAPRGTLEITPSAPRHKMVKFAPARVELAPNASAVGALLASDGFYRLRARSLGGAGPWASASLRACDLAMADFREDVAVSLSARGEVVALTFGNARAGGRGCAAALPEGAALEATATVSTDAVAQVIPVQAKVGKPPSGMGEVLTDAPAGRGGAEGGQAEPQKPKSFLAKYWHIILPLALLLLTTKEPEPESVKTTKAPAKAD